MPGCGQPRLPSGKVTSSADTISTWSIGTPASRATSATTGSTTDAGRLPAPAPDDGCALPWVGPLGPPDDDAAEQPPRTHRAAIRVMRITSILRWYPRPARSASVGRAAISGSATDGHQDGRPLWFDPVGAFEGPL